MKLYKIREPLIKNRIMPMGAHGSVRLLKSAQKLAIQMFIVHSSVYCGNSCLSRQIVNIPQLSRRMLLVDDIKATNVQGKDGSHHQKESHPSNVNFA